MSADYERLKDELSSIASVLKQFPEGLQADVYRVLLKTYLGELPTPLVGQPQNTEEPTSAVEPASSVEPTSAVESANRKPAQKKARQAAKTETLKVIDGLNLNGGEGVPSFKDYCDELNPTNAMEFATVAVNYLTQIMHLTNVGNSHIYSCYRQIERPVPRGLESSVKNCMKTKYGYLKKTPEGLAVTNIVGVNLISRLRSGAKS